ncbi:MAG: 6,7-dimethyl-8-ribityllumazine synthase [Myxococcota bacterium]
MKTYEGSLTAEGETRFAIVSSRFNHFIVDRLVEGARDALGRHGIDSNQLAHAKVPGAWELPLATQQLAQSKSFAAVIVLGAIIRGGTPHFDYVAAEATKGIAAVMMQTGVPVSLGILTTDTIEQAIERAGTKAGNKGFEAAMSALEMANLQAALRADGL